MRKFLSALCFLLFYSTMVHAVTLAEELARETDFIGSLWFVCLVGFGSGVLSTSFKLLSKQKIVESPLRQAATDIIAAVILAAFAYGLCYVFVITGVVALLVVVGSSFFAVRLLNLSENALGDALYSLLAKFGVRKGAANDGA
jgi:hypothetical protein